MASLFSEMIAGDRPGHFVWRDAEVVAVMAPSPVNPGHAIVLPIDEIAHWIDVDPALMQHLTRVAQLMGRAIQTTYSPAKVGLSILGLQVLHTHIHVLPVWSPEDMLLGSGDQSARSDDIAEAAERIRGELRRLGCSEVSD